MPDHQPPHDDQALRAAKRAARLAAKARRSALPPAERRVLSLRACLRLERELAAGKNAVVAGYWPIHDEVDPRPALKAWALRGAGLALPCILPGRRELTFRRYDAAAGEAGLVRGHFGTLEPPPDAPELRPDLVVVPLLAFDEACRRLGYGKGHYDATLAGLPGAKTVGLAFERQCMEAVPVEATDHPLDAVVTDARTLTRATTST